MRCDVAEVQQHADRDEEDAAERVAERQHIGQGLEAVVGLRDDEAREEGTERERHPERGRDVRGAEPNEDDREREDLAVAELGDTAESPRHGEPPADDERRDHDDTEHDASCR